MLPDTSEIEKALGTPSIPQTFPNKNSKHSEASEYFYTCAIKALVAFK